MVCDGTRSEMITLHKCKICIAVDLQTSIKTVRITRFFTPKGR